MNIWNIKSFGAKLNSLLVLSVIFIIGAAELDAQVIDFSGTLDFVAVDTGAGVYSGVQLGTLFYGDIDPETGAGSITDGTTLTNFTCCIAAGALEVTNNSEIDEEAAGLLNLLTASQDYSPGQIFDTINLEGDIGTLGGGRIEIGLSYLFPADTFDNENLDNYPFDPADMIIGIYFIYEEDELGDEVYIAAGALDDPPPGDQPPAKTTINSNGSSTFAVVHGGITKDNGATFVSEVAVGDSIQILVSINPESIDFGANSEVFVVAQVGSTNLLVTPGGLVTWNGSIGSLVAFNEITLQDRVDFNILEPFGGVFTLTSAEIGSYRFFVGFTIGGGVLTYNAQPIELTVVPQ